MTENHEKAKNYIRLAHSNKINERQMTDALNYKWFRLNTLYHIKNKQSERVLFVPNAEQEQRFLAHHGRDIILKARQLGFTTFEMIDSLDDCLFNDDFSAGCICHNLNSAQDIFRNKVKYAYNNISQKARAYIGHLGKSLPVPVNDTGNHYNFSNGSSIKVGTSYRGDTLQRLHVSEFGKICKQHPEKAKEIVTGAFESVPTNGIITLESTAEGRQGYFFKYSEQARKKQEQNKTLSVLDFNFHFYSWYRSPEYSIAGEIHPMLVDYFDTLEHKHGIPLTDEQKAWYSAKWLVLGDDMKREYPSTPKEAFEQSIEGAYYANEFTQIYKDGRIADLTGYAASADVNVVCDIGIGDATSLWFWTEVGEEVQILHYHENSGEGLGYYMAYIEKIAKLNDWHIANRYAPHDMDNREWGSGGKTRKEIARSGAEYRGKTYKAKFEIVPKLRIDDGIQLVRQLLPRCVFDEKPCTFGITCLESYRKEWNDKLGCWRDNPLHDWASHGSDAFRYLAVVINKRNIGARAW